MGTQRKVDIGPLTRAGQGEIKQRGAFASVGIGEYEATARSLLWLRQVGESGAPMRPILDESHGLQPWAACQRRV